MSISGYTTPAQGQKVTDPERAQALRITGKRTHPDSDPESPGGQDGDAELEEFDAPFSQGTERLVTALKAKAGKGRRTVKKVRIAPRN